MKSAMNNFWLSINLALWICVIPIALINKFVYTRLTQRSFVMLQIYWVDIAIFACFSYVYYYHILWLNTENNGLGLG